MIRGTIGGFIGIGGCFFGLPLGREVGSPVIRVRFGLVALSWLLVFGLVALLRLLGFGFVALLVFLDGGLLGECEFGSFLLFWSGEDVSFLGIAFLCY